MSEEGLVRLEGVRLSFPTLATPRAFAPGQLEKYSADFILESDDPAYAEFKKRGAKLCSDKFGAKAEQIIKMISGNPKLRAFCDGSEKVKSDGSQYVGYEDMVAISANTTRKPKLVDANGDDLMNVNKLFGGCYVNAYVKPWVQDNKFGKAIRCELIGIQYVKDGESFGGDRVDTSSLFSAIDEAPEPVSEGGTYQF